MLAGHVVLNIILRLELGATGGAGEESVLGVPVLLQARAGNFLLAPGADVGDRRLREETDDQAGGEEGGRGRGRRTTPQEGGRMKGRGQNVRKETGGSEGGFEGDSSI